MAHYEDLIVDQGTDFSLKLELVDRNNDVKDLTGFTGQAKAKKSFSATTSVDFNVSVQTPASDGILLLQLTNTQTDTMQAGRYVYDVEIQSQDADDNTIVERILEGQITVTPSVTR
jgi:hypothetical protein